MDSIDIYKLPGHNGSVNETTFHPNMPTQDLAVEISIFTSGSYRLLPLSQLGVPKIFGYGREQKTAGTILPYPSFECWIVQRNISCVDCIKASMGQPFSYCYLFSTLPVFLVLKFNH